MEPLLIKHNTYSFVRKLIGVLFLLCGVVYIIEMILEPRPMHIILGIAWPLIGALQLMGALGSSESTVRPSGENLSIKWINWLKTREIGYSEITKMHLSKTEISIERREKKPLRLNIDFFGTDQKKITYQYFIDIAKEKNIELEKKFFS